MKTCVHLWTRMRVLYMKTCVHLWTRIKGTLHEDLCTFMTISFNYS